VNHVIHSQSLAQNVAFHYRAIRIDPPSISNALQGYAGRKPFTEEYRAEREFD
jgi:hypothetical protein